MHLIKSLIYLLPVLCSLLVLQSGCVSSNLQVVNSELTSREFIGDQNIKSSMAVVTGLARNTAETPIISCRIDVKFYDAQGNKIGTAAASRESMSAGETWNFVVQLTGPDSWKARSYDISSYSR
jgi:hypothetical protein